MPHALCNTSVQACALTSAEKNTQTVHLSLKEQCIWVSIKGSEKECVFELLNHIPKHEHLYQNVPSLTLCIWCIQLMKCTVNGHRRRLFCQAWCILFNQECDFKQNCALRCWRRRFNAVSLQGSGLTDGFGLGGRYYVICRGIVKKNRGCSGSMNYW